MPLRAAALRLGWSGRTMSSRSTGNPALAKWAAMRAPMVPAPRTATRRSGVIRARVAYAGRLQLHDLLDDEAVAVHASAEGDARLDAGRFTAEHRTAIGI